MKRSRSINNGDGTRAGMKSPLAVIFLTVALDLVGFGMVVPLLPLYAKQFNSSATQIAFLFASIR
jgi:hypothetical protein